jgi:hypothetical protein
MATENKAATAEARPYRKVRRGLVVSNKMDKTITVKLLNGFGNPEEIVHLDATMTIEKVPGL